MSTVNKVILIGNLTRDPELRYTPKGTAVCEIGLALNRTWKDDNGQTQEEVTFVDITVFGPQGDAAGKHLTKGRQVYIEGRLKLDTWQDKQSGQNRSKLKVVGEQVTFLGNKPDSQGGNTNYDRAQAQAQHQPPQQQRDYPPSGGQGRPYGQGGYQGQGDDLPM
jgi:single-strand DNA-binding protein